jgi:hypothetical protein
MTPFEAWHGRKPAVHYFRTFGCVVHVKDTRPGLKKLDDRSRPMIFVGYEQGSKAYRAYDPASHRVHITRDAVFDEAARWDWSSTDDSVNSDTGADAFTVERFVCSGLTGSIDGSAGGTSSPPPATPHTAEAPPTPLTGASSSTPAPPSVKFTSPPTAFSEMLDAADDGTLEHRFRSMENILAAGPARAPEEEEDELHLLAGEEPATFSEAEQHESWRRAMLEEMSSIEGNKTWHLATLPPGHRAIGLKWVYKVKKDADGNVLRHKARLVAKGYVQRHGVDYDEVFAPVARLESVRLLLALAAGSGWGVHHMDVKSAFLNGELQEEVYAAQPPGFAVKGQEHLVLRLDKALYGLKQAPRA